MSFIRRGTPRTYPFPEPMLERSRTGTLRGMPAPTRQPANPEDLETVVVDPPAMCDAVAAFLDGELGAPAAAAFRTHLATCASCRRDLLEQMQLQARLSELPKLDR